LQRDDKAATAELGRKINSQLLLAGEAREARIKYAKKFVVVRAVKQDGKSACHWTAAQGSMV